MAAARLVSQHLAAYDDLRLPVALCGESCRTHSCFTLQFRPGAGAAAGRDACHWDMDARPYASRYGQGDLSCGYRIVLLLRFCTLVHWHTIYDSPDPVRLRMGCRRNHRDVGAGCAVVRTKHQDCSRNCSGGDCTDSVTAYAVAYWL